MPRCNRRCGLIDRVYSQIFKKMLLVLQELGQEDMHGWSMCRDDCSDRNWRGFFWALAGMENLISPTIALSDC